MKNYVVLSMVIFAGISQDSLVSVPGRDLITVSRLGLIGTGIKMDSLENELFVKDSIVNLYKKQNKLSVGLFNAMTDRHKESKKQRLVYKKRWIQTERKYRSEKNKKYWWSGIVLVLSALIFN